MEAQESPKNSPIDKNKKKGKENEFKNKKWKCLDSSETSTSDKDCTLHGEGCGHDAAECRMPIAQAKKMRATHQAQNPAAYRVLKQKEELNASIAEGI